MKKFRDARLDALGETYDVAFEFKPGAPPTLTAFGEDEDDVNVVMGNITQDGSAFGEMATDKTIRRTLRLGFGFGIFLPSEDRSHDGGQWSFRGL